MTQIMDLQAVLSANGKASSHRLAVFAWLNLGIIESLSSGLLSATEGVRLFYNADNCLFARKSLRVKTADEIMSRGVQLPDLFDILPADEAHRQFQHELTQMRGLCLKLLENRRGVA